MKKHITLFFAALLMGTGSLLSQKQTPPAGGTPKDFILPQKKLNTLPNGLKTSLVQYGNVPKVNVQLVVKTGNVHESEIETWLADLTLNLIKEGTTTMDFKTISRKVAAMGGEINVGVGPDQTFITGSVLSEFAPDLIRIMSDVVMNPAFPEKEIARLKNDMKRQLTVQKSVPQTQAMEKFMKTIYADQPYGRFFPTESMIESYNLEMVKSFYEKNFGARRTVVYVVGKFDEGATEKAIEESFKTWKEGPEVAYPLVKQVHTNEVSIIDRPNAPQTTVLIGLPTLTPQDKDFVSLQVTNSLLGGFFGSRITTNLREDKGYTYSPFSTVKTNKGASIWYEQADVTSEFTGASLQEISKEIKGLQNTPPSQEELDGVQKYMAGIFVLQNSTPAGIINQLNFIDINELDESYLTDRVKNIYAVTPEKVSQLAKDHFKYEDMTLTLVGDKKLLEKQIKDHENAKKLK